jgi:hypothetical protein
LIRETSRSIVKIAVDQRAGMGEAGGGIAGAPQRYAALLRRLDGERRIGEIGRIALLVETREIAPIGFAKPVTVVMIGRHAISAYDVVATVDEIEQQPATGEFVESQRLLGEQFGRGHPRIDGDEKAHALDEAGGE